MNLYNLKKIIVCIVEFLIKGFLNDYELGFGEFEF